MSEKRKRGRPINEGLRDNLNILCGKGPLALSRMTGNNLLSEERVKKALEKHPELYDFFFKAKKRKTLVYEIGRLKRTEWIVGCAQEVKKLMSGNNPLKRSRTLRNALHQDRVEALQDRHRWKKKKRSKPTSAFGRRSFSAISLV